MKWASAYIGLFVVLVLAFGLVQWSIAVLGKVLMPRKTATPDEDREETPNWDLIEPGPYKVDPSLLTDQAARPLSRMAAAVLMGSFCFIWSILFQADMLSQDSYYGLFAEFLNLFAFSLAGALCGAVFTPAFFIPGCAGLLLSVFAGVFAFVGAKILANVMVFLLGFPVENAYGPKKGLVLLMWSLFYTVTGAVFGLIFRYIYVMELLRMRIFSKKQN